MNRGQGAAAQLMAMLAAAFLSLRPLFVDYELAAGERLMQSLAMIAALLAIAFFFVPGKREASPAAQPSSATSDAAAVARARWLRRLAIGARTLAALGILGSLAVRLRESELASTPALFWLAALAAATLAAWLCMHLRPTLIRARFYWAIALGALLAVVSTLDRTGSFATPVAQPGEPEFARALSDPGFNVVLAIGTLLLGEGHPDVELFALEPLYARASSSVDVRTPWFRHVAALAVSLLVGLFVLALRSARLSEMSMRFGGLLLLVLAFAALLAPRTIMTDVITPPADASRLASSMNGAALWLLAGAASLFSPSRPPAHLEGAHT